MNTGNAMPLPSEHRYPALDGLRGLAALMIVWHHFMQFTPVHEKWLAHFARFFGFAWSGVDLFFVLSGFLITGILVDAKTRNHYFRTFYGRRVLRIFPLYYGVLILVLLAAPRLGIQTGVTPASHIFFWTYTSNFYFAFAGWPANYFSHLWTLAIEEQFYLVWPLVIFFAARLERLRFGLLMAFLSVSLLRCVLYFSGINFAALYLCTETHCDALLLGGYLALSIRSTQPGALIGLHPKRWVALLFAMLAFFILNADGLFPGWDHAPLIFFSQNMITLPLLAVLFVWLIHAATKDAAGRISRFFSFPALRWLGKYSYALYILHVPLAFMILENRPSWISSQPLLAEFELFFLFLGSSIAAAFLSWHLYEKHFLKLKRYFRSDPEMAHPKIGVQFSAE
jgi:peptidoglycan/LPS O-acetylase OafA/YrhL